MEENEVLFTVSEEKPKRGGISGSTLKLVAIFTMLIDHIAASILENLLRCGGPSSYANGGLLYTVYSIMRSIGRLAFPIFCFLLVEGFLHTRNKSKYAIRLGIFALISEIPFDLAFEGKMFSWGHQNVFFTLLIGLIVMAGFELVRVSKDKKWLYVLAVAGAVLTGGIFVYLTTFFTPYITGSYDRNIIKGFVALIIWAIVAIFMLLVYAMTIRKKSPKEANVTFSYYAVLFAGMLLAKLLHTDYGGFGVLTIAIMYILRNNKMNSIVGGCVTLTIMSYGEFPSFLDLLLIRHYNGQRGLNLKYVFYLFYPVHLFLLYLICLFMKII
jgi:TraX protein.